MTVSLEEAVKGAEKRVRLPTGKELNVKIPAGVTAGQQIRLKGQGETAQGHPPGDLLITVSIAPHPFFKVDGSDLRVDLPITLYEAVLGGKVRVPTLGSAVELSIPKNTSSGRTFRLKGKGLPKAGGATGDLFVTTRIILPDGNDAELEALMEKVARRPPLQSAQRFRLTKRRSIKTAERGRPIPDNIPAGSLKKGRPRKGDQRGTKPQSRPLAPIGGSSATHFRVITQCDNETHG